MIGGFSKDVFKELLVEFVAEVNQLVSSMLEGSVG
jgi:hypothetical protein